LYRDPKKFDPKKLCLERGRSAKDAMIGECIVLKTVCAARSLSVPTSVALGDAQVLLLLSGDSWRNLNRVALLHFGEAVLSTMKIPTKPYSAKRKPRRSRFE
jgi:hypothetical protein